MTRSSFRDIPNNTAKQWWNDPSLRLNVFYTVGCMLCPFYLGYDQSLLTGLQTLPQWTSYFHSPKGQWLGLISICILLPGTVMGFPASWICNNWGRKICVLIGCVFIIVGAIWNGLGKGTTQFMISRVIMGIGGAITKTAAPALLQKTVHPRLRGSMSTMYYGFYYVGSLLSGIMCIIGLEITGEWGWRLPCILALLGPTVVFAILIKAPDSPRYLVHKGKTEQAAAVLAKYHANGDVNDELVQWKLQEIQYALESESSNSKTSYMDFFKTPGNRKRLWVSVVMAFGVNWVGNGIVSYYLTPVLKSVGVTQPRKILGINVGLAVWNLIISEVAGLYSNKFGRRGLFLISTVGMILSYSFVMGLSAGFATTGKSQLGLAAIPFLFLFFGSYDIAWATLNYSYVSEIMPFNLRTKGLAVYLTVQQIGNVFNQFVNPIALDAIAWKYYAVYIAIDCAYVVMIYLFFPETKSLSIEEVSLIFDYDTKEGRERAAAAFREIQTTHVAADIKKTSAEHDEGRL